MLPLPTWIQGAWHRERYTEPAAGEPRTVDNTTHVVWLQVGQWHADLRVSADRPDFTGIDSLETCDRPRLEYLARQTAFAGVTCIEGQFVQWHRFYDLSPDLEADMSRVECVADTLIERHPAGRFAEYWRFFEDTGPDAECDVLIDSQGHPRWLQWGGHAIRVVPGRTIGSDHDILATPETLDTDALKLRLQLVLDYLRHDVDGRWHVCRSTLPWREQLSGQVGSPESYAE